MKKLLGYAALVLLLASCGPQSAQVPGSAESVPVPVAATVENEAYVLIQDLAMWKEEGGSLKWLKNLSVGDRVKLSGQSGKFKSEGSDAERDYVKIVYGDKEGWVRPAYLATKAKLGVILVEKAKIYSEPRDIKVTTKFLGKMTLVAVYNEGGEGDFAKISGYDYGQKILFVDDIYVNKSDLTMQDMDVNAATLYIASSQAKTAELKINLLSTALEKYSGSFFASQIEADLNVLKGTPAKATAPATGSFIVLEDNVNIRETPDETSGKVLGVISKDAVVQVSEMTSETYTVEGKTSHWYKISDPQGWIFGIFLEPQE